MFRLFVVCVCAQYARVELDFTQNSFFAVLKWGVKNWSKISSSLLSKKNFVCVCILAFSINTASKRKRGTALPLVSLPTLYHHHHHFYPSLSKQKKPEWRKMREKRRDWGEITDVVHISSEHTHMPIWRVAISNSHKWPFSEWARENLLNIDVQWLVF